MAGPMSFIDKINRRIAARAHAKRPRLLVEDGMLVLLSGDGGRQELSLRNLVHATVSYRDVYAGSVIVLRLEFADGIVAEAFEDDGCWFELMAALDQSGMIPTPSTEWQLRFIAAGDNADAVDLMAPSRP